MKTAYIGVVAGLALVAVGLGLWSVPLGLAAGGAGLVWFFHWVYDVEGGEL